MSIANVIQRLQSAKTNIANALISKGVDVPSTHGFESFVSDILNVPQGLIYPATYRGTTRTSYTGKEIAVLRDAFLNCQKISTVSMKNCTYIGSGAFQSCVALKEVNFYNCKFIDSDAFNTCTTLQSVQMPSCSYIGGGAFYNCSALSDTSFPICSYIGDGAFQNCSNLTTMSFPSCTTIGFSTFQSCHRLISLYLMGSTICSLKNQNAFTTTPIGGYSASAGQYGSIYVPASLLTTYQMSTNWMYFSSRFVGVE